MIRPGQVRTKLSAHVKEAPLTVDKEQVATLAVRAAEQGQRSDLGTGRVPLRDDDPAAHPAAHLPQAAHLVALREHQVHADLLPHRVSPERTADRPLRRAAAGLAEAALAAIIAASVAVVGLYAFAKVHWPAYDSSNELRALTTVGQVCCIAIIGVAVWLIRIARADARNTAAARPRRISGARAGLIGRVLSWAGLSGFVTVTLGLPLAATKLYLTGISSDQEFRTEYLTRLTDSPKLRDMTYVGVPPFYPAGWFWIGGRVAHAAGMPGWEAFKPYAIGGMAVAAVVALVLWSKLIRPDLAVVAGLATTAAVLTYDSQEAYGAPIVMLFVPALILAWGGLHRPANGWAAIIGTGLFLGFAATFYTLYLAVAAATVALMAVIAAGLAVYAERRWRAVLPVLLRLVVAAIVGRRHRAAGVDAVPARPAPPHHVQLGHRVPVPAANRARTWTSRCCTTHRWAGCA